MVADGGGVEPGVDACEEDDEVFCGKIRDDHAVRGEELGFGGLPRGGQCLIHSAASWEGILLAVRMLRFEAVILKLLSIEVSYALTSRV